MSHLELVYELESERFERFRRFGRFLESSGAMRSFCIIDKSERHGNERSRIEGAEDAGTIDRGVT